MPSATVQHATGARFTATFDVSTFRKGNLHAHSKLSDGVDTPEDVIAWYRSQGYGFVALTDHNHRAEPTHYAALQDESFTVVAGEEVTMLGGGRQVHVNALCTKRTIGGGVFETVAEALVWAISAVDAQGGVALVNHPNFDRAVSLDDLVEARGASLIEIASGHPYVGSAGVDGRPSHEALWDGAISRGLNVMGAAVDDTHRLRSSGEPPGFPGVGWVEVFSHSASPPELCEALRTGRLYASTGPRLARIRVTGTGYAVWPVAPARVEFVGNGGTVLRTLNATADEPAQYTPRGNEGYVRARIVQSTGTAHTPPVPVEP
jgi:hypothetical protein